MGTIHGDIRLPSKAEDDFSVVGSRSTVAGDVDVAAPSEEPRELGVTAATGRSIARTVGTSEPDLTEVVPSGPGEVADDMRELGDQGPDPPAERRRMVYSFVTMTRGIGSLRSRRSIEWSPTPHH